MNQSASNKPRLNIIVVVVLIVLAFAILGRFFDWKRTPKKTPAPDSPSEPMEIDFEERRLYDDAPNFKVEIPIRNSRIITWSIESEELPASSVTLYSHQEKTSNKGTSTPTIYYRLGGYETFTEAPFMVGTIFGAILAERSRVGGKTTQRYMIEKPSVNYMNWTSNLTLEIRFEQKPTKDISVTVEAPSDGIEFTREFSASELGDRLRIQSNVEL